MQQYLPRGDIGQEIYLREEQKPEALAGQTARATDDIAKQIADMQHATLSSIDAIGAIARTIRDIGAISGAISAAVTEQGAATQEIARNVDIAAKRTSDTAEEVSRVNDATPLIAQMAANLRQSCGQRSGYVSTGRPAGSATPDSPASSLRTASARAAR